MHASLAAQGAVPTFEDPETFAARERRDIAKWTEVIKAAGLHAEVTGGGARPHSSRGLTVYSSIVLDDPDVYRGAREEILTSAVR